MKSLTERQASSYGKSGLGEQAGINVGTPIPSRLHAVAGRITSLVASNFYSQSMRLPERRAQWHATKSASRDGWWQGSACSSTSPRGSPGIDQGQCVARQIAVGRVAPLARPVVPEVERIAARSSGAETTVSNRPALRARSSSVPRRRERQDGRFGRALTTAAHAPVRSDDDARSASPKKYAEIAF